MHTIKNLQHIIEQAVNQQKFPSKPKELYQPINYLMQLGGKRLRPALLLMAVDLFNGDVNKAIHPALAIETFHNFTLMHDDIMDKAPLRRGKPTVHEKWSESVAILSGDVMFVEAFKLMIKVESSILSSVLSVFNDTAVGVCEGQQIDMNFESLDNVSIDDYLEMIRLKTAVLLGGALKIGALIGKSSAEEAQKLYDFGVHLGIAFQLQDDILDVYGDPKKFGKKVGGDIILNKKTYLLIKAKSLAKGKEKILLESWLNQKDLNQDEKIKAVTDIYNDLNIKSIAEDEMFNHAEKALILLDEIAVSDDRKVILKEFASMIIDRQH